MTSRRSRLLFAALSTIGLCFGSTSRGATVSLFTGGDVGEGLDLDGNFPYAVHMANDGASYQVRNALFTQRVTAGVSYSFNSEFFNFAASPSYGNTTNDNNLESAMDSELMVQSHLNVVWGEVDISLSNLQVGGQYKLSLLFGDNPSGPPTASLSLTLPSGSALSVNPRALQAGTQTKGVVVTDTFTAASSSVMFTDRSTNNSENALLNAFTLELVPEPSSMVLAALSLGVIPLLAVARRIRLRSRALQAIPRNYV